MHALNPNINETIQRLEISYSHNPNLFYLSVLGIQYLERNEEGDVNKALDAFEKVINSNDESKDALRAKGVAYSRRGKYYRIQKIYDWALKDLSEARREKYYNEVTDFEKNTIAAEYKLIQSQLNPEVIESENVPLFNLEAGINENKFFEKCDLSEANSSPLIDSFYHLLEFLDKDDDSCPQVSLKSAEQSYWKGFVYCRNALHFYINNDYKIDDRHLKKLKKASYIFQKLKKQECYIPSNISCYLATIYHFLNRHEEALFEINEAIGRNDSEVTYYKVRRYIYLDLASKNSEKKEDYLQEAEKDLNKILELQPFSNTYYKVLKSYIEVKHTIDFYNQVKTDKNTYFEVLKNLLELQKISPSEFNSNLPDGLKENPFSFFKNLSEEELISIFQRFDITIKRSNPNVPISVFESIPLYLYGLLSQKLDLDMVPKRGETLGSLEDLSLKAAFLSSILAKENSEKIEATIDHALYVIENTSPTEDFSCNWAKAHLLLGTFLKSLGKDEEARTHTDLLLKTYPNQNM